MLRKACLAYDEGHLAEADVRCRRFLRMHPIHPGALHLLGQIHATLGDQVEAIRVLEQSLVYGSDDPGVWTDLARACHQSGKLDQAIQHLKRAISLQSSFFRAYAQLANLYHELGRIEDVAELYRQWAERDPNSAEVAHMAAATSGEAVPDRCPVAYVRTHFDKLAASFDRRLVDDLGYTGHELAASALAKHTPAGARWANVLDAGCGTGLCGPLLRPHCQRLLGLDLSTQMIEQARLRGCYDELVVGEFCAFMRSRPAEFDVIVSSDVLIYIGKLEEPIYAAHRALRPEALLVVTFEALPGQGTGSFQLQTNGRYAHRNSYIQSTLAEAGFDLLHCEPALIRREFGQDVRGLLAVARKNA